MGACKTSFEFYRKQQKEARVEPWSPFESEDEWELARWLMSTGVSQKKMDTLLKLKMVIRCLPCSQNKWLTHMFKIQESGPDQNGPSFHNSHALLQRIDVLPKRPEWICVTFHITGDELDKNGERCTEDVELWHQDPVECIKELISNSAFQDKLVYSPLRIYEDEQMTNRIYNEMWTCNWWWDIQVWRIMIVWVNEQHLICNRTSFPMVQQLRLLFCHQTRPSFRHSAVISRHGLYI